MIQSITTQRRLAAIVIADIVGYTRLMEAHEEYTFLWQTRLRTEIIDPTVETHHGRIVKNTGDGFLAIFDTASAATDFALAFQRGVAARTIEQPIERRISFRVGVHVADIIVSDDDVYGIGVNVAARLQTYAESGTIVISGAVAEQLGDAPGVSVIDLGELHLHNMTHAVRVLSLRPQTAPARLVGDSLAGSDARPSIAVLPFRMHLTGPEERYFADGMVDNIIQALATLKDLFVLSRATAASYSGPALDARAVGAELGVRYTLYGSVLRSGGRLRITTELYDTETGTIIRSDQHEGSMDDLFHLQEQIVVDVIKSIAPHIRERELVRAMLKHPQNLTAYDLVLQAVDLLYRIDYESFSRARGLLQQAIAHDPDYAPAYYYTARWYNLHYGEMGSTDTDGDARAAIHYASEAITRDPDDPLALAMFGLVYGFFVRDFAVAIQALDRALQAGPSVATAWAMSSLVHGYLGDVEVAIQHGEQAVRLSPLDSHLFWHESILAQAHYIAEQYDQAVGWALSSFDRNREMRANIRTLIASFVGNGQIRDAADVAQYLLRIQPGFRLSQYGPRCPFPTPLLERWLEHLRASGLPD